MNKNDLLKTLSDINVEEIRRLCNTVEALQTLHSCIASSGDGDNCDHGNTLDEVIAGIRNQPHEIIALFDKNNNKIFEHTSHDRNYVRTELTPSQYEKATISLHNHVDDVTFSPVDLDLGPNIQLTTNILVTPSSSYYICRPDHGWPKSQEWLEEYENLITNIYLTSKRNLSRHEARHEALLRVTSHYGIRYYVNDLEGNTISSNM